MGSSLNFAKTILIPASIALAVYLLLTLLVLPIIRRYHQRYSQYLPLHTLSAHTLSLRDRVADAIMRFFLPSSWRRNAHLHQPDNDNISIDEEEGELMVGMDMDADARRRREALEARRSLGPDMETEGRLSRELEEGFMDESDEEEEERVVRGVLGMRR